MNAGIYLHSIVGVRASAQARERRRPMLHALVLGLILLGALVSVFLSRSFPFQAQEITPITGLSLPSVGATRGEEPVLTSDVLPDTVRREEVAEGFVALSGGNVAEGEATAPGSAAGAAVVEPAPVVQYRLYAVQQGDSASAIASLFGIDLQYLLWANLDLRDGELLTIGQMLVVPGGNGLLYDVRYGDTIGAIAARYDVPVENIVSWPGNDLQSADQVVEDQLVFVPGGVPPVSILPEATPLPVEAPVSVEAPPAPAPAPPAGPVSSIGLSWPVTGPISSYYGAAHPLGIDIDLYNNFGSPVAAATSGTVTFAGGDPCCSYGLYVVLVSPNGIETVYAHFSSVGVSIGQEVAQGAYLGSSGCTGYCTGSHLHFEVIDNGVRVNPLGYLP